MVRRLTTDTARRLARVALEAAGTPAGVAARVAAALVAAELAGQAGHGLVRVPSYAAQVRSGKVVADAVPRVEHVAAALLRVDAGHGFAHPALDLAGDELLAMVPDTGVALAAVHRSHHVGVAGQHVERLAERGLVALLVANTPAAMAPWGGSRPLYGTDPVAFAAPRSSGPPLVVDLSLSTVARGRVAVAEREGRAIPEGWGLDAQGRPTTDPAAVMRGGSMLPVGGAKGAALALVVEVLAAAVAGAAHGGEASSFFAADGPPPGVGQVLLALDPGRSSGGAYTSRLEALLSAVLEQDGVRLPGSSRLVRVDRTHVTVPDELHRELLDLAGGA